MCTGRIERTVTLTWMESCFILDDDSGLASFLHNTVQKYNDFHCLHQRPGGDEFKSTAIKAVTDFI